MQKCRATRLRNTEAKAKVNEPRWPLVGCDRACRIENPSRSKTVYSQCQSPGCERIHQKQSYRPTQRMFRCHRRCLENEDNRDPVSSMCFQMREQRNRVSTLECEEDRTMGDEVRNGIADLELVFQCPCNLVVTPA